MLPIESNGKLGYSQAMELVRYFNKNLGETPLEALNRFKSENPEYLGQVATYAGRLDPAAEGELLFLFGDMVHKKDEYLAHNKIYIATFALGVSTDTGDLLGLPVGESTIPNLKPCETISEVDEEKIKNVLIEIKNIKVQKYPAYSSKTVEGKPLFVHTREGNNVDRPTRAVEIFSCELVETKVISREALFERVKKVCGLVTGDFRQNEILNEWEKINKNCSEKITQDNSYKKQLENLSPQIPLITVSLHVSSGTYIRTMTEIFEKVFGVPAVLFKLVRSEIKNEIKK